MNVPAIAKKSFDELQKKPEFLSIVKKMLKRLKRISSSLERARFIHKTIDEYNEEVFSHPLVKELSPCRRGCMACCHTQVSVTADEAELLIMRVNNGLIIDKERLKSLMHAGDDARKYFAIPFKERACIFLDSAGACRVYEDRPAVCRTNAVLGPASQCDTTSSVLPTRLIRTPKSDMVIYASYMFSKKSGSLPHMVGKTLLKEAELPSN
jgi:Fe-S-cluster containining protein